MNTDLIAGLWLGFLITSAVWTAMFLGREKYYRNELRKLQNSEKTVRHEWDELTEDLRAAWKNRHPEDFRE